MLFFFYKTAKEREGMGRRKEAGRRKVKQLLRNQNEGDDESNSPMSMGSSDWDRIGKR